MGIKVRERIKGCGIYWVFINYQGQRRAIKAGEREVADEVASEFNKKISPGHREYNPAEVFKKPEPLKPTFKVLAKQWLEEVKE